MHGLEEQVQGQLACFAGVPGKITWIEVDAPKLKEAYQERYWPGDLRPILDQLPRKSGTPRFLIVRDGKVIANEFGSSQWTKVLAELKKQLD